jgi:hypothetical protein
MSQSADHKKHTECSLCQITPQQLWAYLITAAVAWGTIATTVLWLRADLTDVKESVSRIETRVYTLAPTVVASHKE